MTSVNVYSKEQTDAKLLLKQAQLTVTPAGGSQTDIADTVDESPDNTYANRLVTSKGVYTALSGKADDSAVAHLTGASFTGPVAFADSVTIGASGDTADLTQVGNVNLTGNLTISGDITQNGSSYETHAQHVYTTNDYIITRDGATGALSAGTYSGFQVKKYDGTNDGRLVVDSSGTARVGDVGDEQPLLTRAESSALTDGDLLKWDGTNLKAVGVAVDSAPTQNSTNLVSSGGVYTAIDGCAKLSGGTSASPQEFTGVNKFTDRVQIQTTGVSSRLWLSSDFEQINTPSTGKSINIGWFKNGSTNESESLAGVFYAQRDSSQNQDDMDLMMKKRHGLSGDSRIQLINKYTNTDNIWSCDSYVLAPYRNTPVANSEVITKGSLEYGNHTYTGANTYTATLNRNISIKVKDNSQISNTVYNGLISVFDAENKFIATIERMDHSTLQGIQINMHPVKTDGTFDNWVTFRLCYDPATSKGYAIVTSRNSQNINDYLDMEIITKSDLVALKNGGFFN